MARLPHSIWRFTGKFFLSFLIAILLLQRLEVLLIHVPNFSKTQEEQCCYFETGKDGATDNLDGWYFYSHDDRMRRSFYDIYPMRSKENLEKALSYYKAARNWRQAAIGYQTFWRF